MIVQRTLAELPVCEMLLYEVLPSASSRSSFILMKPHQSILCGISSTNLRLSFNRTIRWQTHWISLSSECLSSSFVVAFNSWMYSVFLNRASFLSLSLSRYVSFHLILGWLMIYLSCRNCIWMTASWARTHWRNRLFKSTFSTTYW